MRQYKAQMYSVRPLPTATRKDFLLVGDPYTHETQAMGRQAIEYLRSFGVVFYRDEFSPVGLLIQPPDDNPLPLSERSGWLGYKSSLMMETDERTFVRVAGWQKPSAAIIRKHGDDRAWLEFNRPYNIRAMDETQVLLS